MCSYQAIEMYQAVVTCQLIEIQQAVSSCQEMGSHKAMEKYKVMCLNQSMCSYKAMVSYQTVERYQDMGSYQAMGSTKHRNGTKIWPVKELPSNETVPRNRQILINSWTFTEQCKDMKTWPVQMDRYQQYSVTIQWTLVSRQWKVQSPIIYIQVSSNGDA